MSPAGRKAMLAGVLVSPLALCACGPDLSAPEPPVVAFDAKAWSADAGRWGQGHALAREGLLIGKTRREVLDLLGRPVAGESPDHLGYDIGGLGYGEYLEIDLDPDGHVVRVWFSNY